MELDHIFPALDDHSSSSNQKVSDESIGFDRPSSEVDAELDSYRAALNQIAIVALTDRGGTILHVNDRFCEISGFSRDELTGAKHSLVNSGHHPRGFFVEMWQTISRGGIWHGEICNRRKGGGLYWVDTTIVPKRDKDGRIDGYVSIRYDITLRKQAEAALLEENRKRQQAEALLRDVIESLPNGIAAFDQEDRLFLFNSALKECYPAAGRVIAEGATLESLLRYAVDHGQFANVSADEAAKEAWIAARMRHHRNPGRGLVQHLSGDRWIHVQERRSASGYIVGVRTDVSELKRAERQIKVQAETDPLTGLSNRRVVLDRLHNALSSRRQAERTGALVLVDLDGFKAVNDTFGHDAGDRLLVEIGTRFRQAVRKTDVVARLGGDEFAFILWGLTSETHTKRILEKLLKSLKSPVQFGRKSLTPSGSLGVAMFPAHGSKPLDLMKHADIALYEAKRGGRSRFVIYDTAMRKAVEHKRAMVQALTAALNDDEIEIVLQPQVSFVNGRHSGFEALLRWQHNGNHIPPPHIIALAEESGQIGALGRRILEKAFTAFQRMKSRMLDPGKLSVNVAAAQIDDSGFASMFAKMLEDRGLRPQEIVVEVTENVVLESSGATLGRTLEQLHETGVGIALDDFGTGYASLSHLKRFPIDLLKIDRSFVRDISETAENGVIARTIISLAHSLDMEVVAEGIETETQYRILSNMGCDYAQGFLIGHPMSDGELKDYLQAAPRTPRVQSVLPTRVTGWCGES